MSFAKVEQFFTYCNAIVLDVIITSAKKAVAVCQQEILADGYIWNFVDKWESGQGVD